MICTVGGRGAKEDSGERRRWETKETGKRADPTLRDAPWGNEGPLFFSPSPSDLPATRGTRVAPGGYGVPSRASDGIRLSPRDLTQSSVLTRPSSRFLWESPTVTSLRRIRGFRSLFRRVAGPSPVEWCGTDCQGGSVPDTSPSKGFSFRRSVSVFFSPTDTPSLSSGSWGWRVAFGPRPGPEKERTKTKGTETLTVPSTKVGRGISAEAEVVHR